MDADAIKRHMAMINKMAELRAAALARDSRVVGIRSRELLEFVIGDCYAPRVVLYPPDSLLD